jgi:8-amino-7-oxononanoate synthase
MGAKQPTDLSAELAAELEALDLAGRLRSVEGRAGASAAPNAPIDFTSNDYLGLASHPRVIEAGRAAMARYGAGGRAARLLGGGAGHGELESLAADWLGTEAALFFPSGYQANLGLLTSLARAGDVVFSAAANHASIIDGLRLAKARVVVFDHRDLIELEEKLRTEPASKRRFVVVEGVYSMDGDLAPLAALDSMCKRYDAYLIVDEAHSVGLIGPGMRGAAHALTNDPETRLIARTITGGKALGTGGALVVGSRVLIDVLLNRSRSFIFTTASTPALAASFAEAIAVVKDEPELGRRALVHARALATALDLPVPEAAILSVVLGDEQVALKASTALWNLGFDVRAVRPPTVPAGSSRLRIVTHAFHTKSEVERLAQAFRDLDLIRQIQVTPASREQVHAPLAKAVAIAGTGTDVGKTVAAALVSRAYKGTGDVCYWKPVQTGADSDSETVRRLAALDKTEVAEPSWQLALPASPHEAASAEGVSVRPEGLAAALLELRKGAPTSRLVVELAGGLLVPYAIQDGHADLQVDWLRRVGVPAILVARSGLGTLNHTLLSLEAMRTRHLVPVMILLIGPRHDSNAKSLRELSDGTPVIEIPVFQVLDTNTLDDWLRSSTGCEFARLLERL